MEWRMELTNVCFYPVHCVPSKPMECEYWLTSNDWIGESFGMRRKGKEERGEEEGEGCVVVD
jgi:hypothetical protein